MHKPEAKIHEDGTTITVIASKHAPSKKRTHPVTIYTHHDGEGQARRWTVEHHHDGTESTEHDFQDGHEMLVHIANHAGVPEPQEEGKESDQYE